MSTDVFVFESAVTVTLAEVERLYEQACREEIPPGEPVAACATFLQELDGRYPFRQGTENWAWASGPIRYPTCALLTVASVRMTSTSS